MGHKIKNNTIITDTGGITYLNATVTADDSITFISGLQGTISGYTSGGETPTSNVIDKFPFATDTNATDVGDLSQTRQSAAGQSSINSGYTSGGIITGNTIVNTVDKFPFSSDANASDVGDLTQSRRLSAGQQV